MRKRRLLLSLLLLLGLVAVVAWQVPAILKAVPSRYVARLPEPVQALGVRDHVDVLPTAAVFSSAQDLSHLLEPNAVEAASLAPTRAPSGPPATPTPPPTFGPAVTTSADTTLDASPTATTSPTETPVPTATRIPVPDSTRLRGVQHRFQDWNNCGPATLAMSLTYFDIYRTQEQTASVLKPDPEDRNVSPWEMASYVNDETDLAALYRANGDLYTIQRLLSSGYPVIVEVGIDPPGDFAWMEWYGHYLLPVAYEQSSQNFWMYDSWFGTSEVPQENANDEGRIISFEELDNHWRQFNRSYIVLYPPADEAQVAAIIGPNMDDDVMWQGALSRVQDELKEEPENAHLWFNLGTVYNALGRYDSAAQSFDKARSLGLPWRMLWYQFGPYEAYYEVGRYQDVIDLADVTLLDRPYFEEAFYYKGLAQIALGQTTEGRRSLQKAAAFNPNFAPAQAALDS